MTDDILVWIEGHAIDNLRDHARAADDIKRDAGTTLNILVAGGAGSLVYAMDAAPKVVAGVSVAGFATALGVVLLVLAVVLVHWCLRVRDFPAVHNEPGNLRQPGFSLAAIREAELDNIQQRITTAAARNRRTAEALNVVRYCVAAAPLVAFIASWAVGLAS